MAEQQIGFCTTADGVRIAYSTIGSGPPLLYIPGWTSHLELDLEDARNSDALELVTRLCTLIRLDKRGTGLSDRGLGDYSLEPPFTRCGGRRRCVDPATIRDVRYF